MRSFHAIAGLSLSSIRFLKFMKFGFVIVMLLHFLKKAFQGEGEGGMIWENGIETCILSCKKRIGSLCSIQDTGCLGLVYGDDPER